MRNLTILSLLILVAAVGFAEDSTLPSDAQALLDRAAQEVAEIDNKATASKYQVNVALLPKLRAAQERATRAGKLDAALAVKERLDLIQKAIDEAMALRSMDGSTGLTAAQLVKRIPRMKATEWDALPGTVLTFAATAVSLPTEIQVAKGESYVIVPNPADTWAIGPVPAYPKVRGDSTQFSVTWSVGGSEPKRISEDYTATGTGILTLAHTDPGNASDNWGSIRVKVIKLQ